MGKPPNERTNIAIYLCNIRGGQPIRPPSRAPPFGGGPILPRPVLDAIVPARARTSVGTAAFPLPRLRNLTERGKLRATTHPPPDLPTPVGNPGLRPTTLGFPQLRAAAATGPGQREQGPPIRKAAAAVVGTTTQPLTRSGSTGRGDGQRPLSALDANSPFRVRDRRVDDTAPTCSLTQSPPREFRAAVRVDGYPTTHPLKFHRPWSGRLPPWPADANAPARAFWSPFSPTLSSTNLREVGSPPAPPPGAAQPSEF